ncbi:hypothetical protein JZU46_06125 [bacterium]|nr:hypothetical protein [bacterium]
MYSANGRKNDNKEKASKTTTPTVKKLLCDDCGFTEAGRFKEFGEIFNCSRCNSEHVHFVD